MALRLKYEGPPRGKWAAGIKSAEQPIARAITTTFREAAKEIEAKGRAEIAGKRFSRRWQAGFTVRVTPRQFSLQPVITGRHRIGFANIFERGGTIRGKPLLWLPLPTAPKKIGGKRTSAGLYVRAVGPLVSINRPGKPPLLAGQAARRTGRTSLASLRTGARRSAAGRRTVLVPLFVGIRQAQIGRRLNVSPIYDRVRDQLGEMYLRNFQKTPA